MTKLLEKSLDGICTGLLRMSLNVSWNEYRTNKDLYYQLPQVSSKMAERRFKLPILWEPTEERLNKSRKVEK